MLEIVQRFAEQGYQLDPDALEIIKSYPGTREDLIRRIISSLDSSVAVISASHVDSIISDSAQSSQICFCVVEARSRRCNEEHISASLQEKNIEPKAELNYDITGRSTCVGEYEDFTRYFRDRYSKIREMLSRRLNSRPIESLGRGTSGREVSLIGMVMDVRTTAKGNRVLELEDPTGMVTAIIQKDSEIFDQSKFILTDEVLGMTGVSDGNGRIFVKSLLWPDMPNQCRPLSEGEGYALLTSDLHVGSKYFLEDAWQRFVNWVNCETNDPSGMAAQVKYIVVAGDVADGIGVYPGQEEDLSIKDIYEQYEKAADCLNSIREDISIIIAPGNHDIVRQAEPQPNLPESVQKFFKGNKLFVGNPAQVTLGGTSLLIYHGRSIDDLVLRIPGLSYGEPEKAMIEMLRRRHLCPVYGGRVSIAPSMRTIM